MSPIFNRRRPRHSATERGIVLITGLVFTVILTLLVLAGLRTGLLEERMALNARNRQLALQASEAVLRDGEDGIKNAVAAPFNPFVPTAFTPGCESGLCSKPTGNTPRWTTHQWTDADVTRSFASSSSDLSSTLVPSQPRYFVELMSTPVFSPSGGGGICPAILYRLSARGLGHDAATVYVQTMYRNRPQFC